jgi:hypothetical protein
MRRPRKVLDLRDLRRAETRRLAGERKRQEVVAVVAGDRGPAEVVGHDRRIDAIGQNPEPPQVAGVQRIRGADRERDAVERDRIVAPDALQHRQRTAARHHEVLGDRLEERDVRPRLDDRVEVLLPEADSAARQGRPAVSLAHGIAAAPAAAISSSTWGESPETPIAPTN